MELQELIKKVRRIEIITKKVVDEALSGQYKSHFKGQGVQFSEHRVYIPGDDVRHIDWKVSARTKELLIKKYDEERELSVLLVVDVSGSQKFGSGSKSKSEVAAEIAGILAYAATHTGDRVGLVLFGGEVEELIPPRKGQKHVLRIVRTVLGHESKSQGTSLVAGLKAARNLLKHAGVVFVISDFITDENYEAELKLLNRRNDVVSIWIDDPKEFHFPKQGHVLIHDPESGKEFFVNSDSYAFQSWLGTYRKQFELKTQGTFKNSKVQFLRLSSRTDHVKEIVKFFKLRDRRTG